MSITINNNSHNYSNINFNGRELDTANNFNNNIENDSVQKLDNAGKIECQTCKDRKYQDVSDDPGVSFKTPSKITGNAGAAVMSHEQEHVRNETAKAAREDRKIVSQSVTLQTSICPECGTAYVSGGTTRTVTKSDNVDEKKDFFISNYNDTVAKNFGLILDVRV